jgi:AcrR family transcriptional regulator
MATVVRSDLTTFARIRNAALAAFAANGVEATSIRDIADDAGVSAGLVQHYFPTKAALRAAVNEHVIAVAAARFEDVSAALDRGDPFQELGDRITGLVAANPDEARYAARAIAEGDEDALRLFDGFVEIARGQLERLAAEGALRPDLDREWAVLHVVVFNLATILFRDAIERRLAAPFLSPEQLRRWNKATTTLMREGTVAVPPCE